MIFTAFQAILGKWHFNEVVFFQENIFFQEKTTSFRNIHKEENSYTAVIFEK
jgi:hypothetical protein